MIWWNKGIQPLERNGDEQKHRMAGVWGFSNVTTRYDYKTNKLNEKRLFVKLTDTLILLETN